MHQAVQPYVLEARVMEGSPLAGRTIEQNRMRGLDGLFLLEIERKGRMISPVGPDEMLEEGDTLVFTGEVDKVSALSQFAGLQVFGHGADTLLRSNLVEVDGYRPAMTRQVLDEQRLVLMDDHLAHRAAQRALAGCHFGPGTDMIFRRCFPEIDDIKAGEVQEIDWRR